MVKKVGLWQNQLFLLAWVDGQTLNLQGLITKSRMIQLKDQDNFLNLCMSREDALDNAISVVKSIVLVI
jgi:hypothetical protein